jgi:predicted PurR-regulated permease PerM
MFSRILVISVLAIFPSQFFARPSEQERVQLWYEAGNTWPPNWSEEGPVRRKFLEEREKELQRIPGSLERWENYMQFTQSRLFDISEYIYIYIYSSILLIFLLLFFSIHAYIIYRLVPSFTEKGFDIIDTPPHIQEKLLRAVQKGIDDFDSLPMEHDVDAIYHPPGSTTIFVIFLVY